MGWLGPDGTPQHEGWTHNDEPIFGCVKGPVHGALQFAAPFRIASTRVLDRQLDIDVASRVRVKMRA